MLKPDGNKIQTCVILTRELADYVDRRAAAYGMSRAAYIRMLIAQDAISIHAPLAGCDPKRANGITGL